MILSLNVASNGRRELQNKDNLLFFTNGSYSMSKNENQISFRVL
jgi:hypothetical protein